MKEISIVGAGGLGTPAAWGLVTGTPSHCTLKIIDPDLIELSNLNRQVFFRESDVGKSKASVLAERLKEISTDLPQQVKLLPVEANLELANIEGLLADSDFVIDATDSPATKLLINDYCVLNRIPYCYGGCTGLEGLILPVVPGQSACLRCTFGDIQEIATGSCQSAGILGSVAASIGFQLASRALEFLSSGIMDTKLKRVSLSKESSFEVQSDVGCPLLCSERSLKIVDLRDKRCPATYLYTKVALEQIGNSTAIDLRFQAEEYAQSVMASCQADGHLIRIPPQQISGTSWRMVIESQNA